jgi:hypothetical protein
MVPCHGSTRFGSAPMRTHPVLRGSDLPCAARTGADRSGAVPPEGRGPRAAALEVGPGESVTPATRPRTAVFTDPPHGRPALREREGPARASAASQ